VLLLWGERDEAFPVPVAIDACARLPRAELRLLPAGHSPHVEAPGRVLEEMRRWLGRVERREVTAPRSLDP
jgi:pimeloyl-ACP methyl ester carboxylesterase